MAVLDYRTRIPSYASIKEEKGLFSPLDLPELTRRNASLSSVSIAEGEE